VGLVVVGLVVVGLVVGLVVVVVGYREKKNVLMKITRELTPTPQRK